MYQNNHTQHHKIQKPTGAFVGASWSAMLIGIGAFLVGLWNAEMQIMEKGYYFTVLMYALFSSISLQKSVRDKLEGIPVTGIYYALAWASIALTILLMVSGLWNSNMEQSEKGFYAISFLLSIFASIAVQKNTRDLALYPSDEVENEVEEKDTTE